MKKALITGASRGIGAAIATTLAKEGYELYLVARNSEKKLHTLCTLLTDTYQVPCHPYLIDVSDAKQVNALFDQIDQLDLLINNAGISHVGLLSDMTDAQWHTVIDTNLSAVFYTCRKAIPLFLKEHKGKIINISSVWGTVGASTEVAYSASKGGVNSFTKALAKELAPSNIQVNAIACGLIDTDMNSMFTEEELACVIAEIPSDRIGQPYEVAQCVSAILHASDYLTGQVITLDGGWI